MAAGRSVLTTPRVGLVGTYPPTRCGIATFNASLAEAITTAMPECRIGVVACADRPPPPGEASDVVAELRSVSAEARAAAVAALRDFDVAIVQHEFGIYGGPDGSEGGSLLRELTVPSIVGLHTGLRRPPPGAQATDPRAGPDRRAARAARRPAGRAERGCTCSPARAVRRRFDEGADDPARGAAEHRAGACARRRRRTRRPHVGLAERRQGDRVGHRRDGD